MLLDAESTGTLKIEQRQTGRTSDESRKYLKWPTYFHILPF